MRLLIAVMLAVALVRDVTAGSWKDALANPAAQQAVQAGLQAAAETKAQEDAKTAEQARVQKQREEQQRKQAEEVAREDAKRQAADAKRQAGEAATAKETALADEAFDMNELEQRAKSQKGKTLVFKKFYLGMPITDALQLANYSMGYRQTLPTSIEDTTAISQGENSNDMQANLGAEMLKGLGSGVAGMTPEQLRQQGMSDEDIAALGIIEGSSPYRVYRRGDKVFVARGPRDVPFATASVTGAVVRFQLGPEVLKRLFDAGSLPTTEFLETFANAYGLPTPSWERQKIKSSFMGESKDIGVQNVYLHRDRAGYEVTYYADSVYFDEEAKPFSTAVPDGTMVIRLIKTADERSAAFD